MKSESLFRCGAGVIALLGAGHVVLAQTTGPVSCLDAPITGVLAHVTGGNTVGAEIREKDERADGYFHLDTPRMIERLKALHANTYNYLIWNSASDFDDLREEFLPAAEKAGIKVWVYLVPPHESVKKASYPYKMDYEKWAKALAELGNQYPVLEAWAMDDFTVKAFPPEYVRKLQEIAHGIDPHLRFFPVFQFTSVTKEWVEKYGPLVDGVVAPYLDLPYVNTQRTGSLEGQINAAHELLGKEKPVYVLVYAARDLSAALEPTAAYVGEAVKICLGAMREGRLGGVVSYGTFLDEDAPLTRPNRALDGVGRLSLARGRMTAKVGDWARASQEIVIDPKTPRVWLRFWHHDQWGAGDTAGLLEKEVLIDDQVVWKADPAGDARDTWFEGGSLEGPVDLTEVLKGKSTATLTIRLRTVKEFSGSTIDVSFDRLSSAGFTVKDPGFETGEGWKIEDSGGSLLAAVDRFDGQGHRRVFETVSRLFEGFGSKE